MTGIHLGFITNNAGDGIPGSTIKWTIKTFKKYFKSILVVDGKITTEAKNWYNEYGIKFIDAPWTGKHIDQYIIRSNYFKENHNGDWLLALDCDEAPTFELATCLEEIIKWCELKQCTHLMLPTEGYISFTDDKYFPTIYGDYKDRPSKNIFYIPGTERYITNNTGTHVTIVANDYSRMKAIKVPYMHLKCLTTVIFNTAITIMDDLYENNNNTPGRGMTEEQGKRLFEIGTKYNLLTKENFRIATKQDNWPPELVELVKEFKHIKHHCRSLYLLYFCVMNHKDTDPLQIEEILSFITPPEVIINNIKNGTYISIPHTDSWLPSIDTACGAG